MIRVEVVREKVRRLVGTTEALSRVLPESADALALDRDRRDLVAFRVYLLMQEAIDLAAHVIAEEGLGPAPSLREHFTIVAERGVVDAAIAQQLAAGVKVRNGDRTRLRGRRSGEAAGRSEAVAAAGAAVQRRDPRARREPLRRLTEFTQQALHRRPVRPRRSFGTSSSASTAMRVFILLCPRRRSEKWIGISTMRCPARAMR